MFTTIDKNLLIASLESALLYAQTSAGVTSLEELTTQVTALRAAFDADQDSVTDTQLNSMIATLQALEIPDPAQLSRLLTVANIGSDSSYLAVCSWATLLNKPATFPPATHQHPWSEITYKPVKFPATAHTHPTENPITLNVHKIHSWEHVPNPVIERGGVFQELATKPDLDAKAAADHTHPATIVTWETVTEKPDRFDPSYHTHSFEHIDDRQELEILTIADCLLCSIALFPAGIPAEYYIGGLRECDGSEIPRTLPGGYALEAIGFPFGIGDGVTTCNLPTMTAPAGFVYQMFVGTES